eukprot:TRINITY_DN3286_c0_g3_i6.p1 TRINITY_DN3286_c0_g3~~TRINITY_DN3286_c0_g3_i6.p1  ORF type:complete len:722 (-),score=98.45 TRINITY_DN3286_c0_g3_i6:87-2252(-)
MSKLSLNFWLVLLAVGVTCQQNLIWPVWHHDGQNTGYSNLSTITGSTMEWIFPSPNFLSFQHSPVISANGILYTTARPSLPDGRPYSPGLLMAINSDGTLNAIIRLTNNYQYFPYPPIFSSKNDGYLCSRSIAFDSSNYVANYTGESNLVSVEEIPSMISVINSEVPGSVSGFIAIDNSDFVYVPLGWPAVSVITSYGQRAALLTLEGEQFPPDAVPIKIGTINSVDFVFFATCGLKLGTPLNGTLFAYSNLKLAWKYPCLGMSSLAYFNEKIYYVDAWLNLNVLDVSGSTPRLDFNTSLSPETKPTASQIIVGNNGNVYVRAKYSTRTDIYVLSMNNQKKSNYSLDGGSINSDCFVLAPKDILYIGQQTLVYSLNGNLFSQRNLSRSNPFVVEITGCSIGQNTLYISSIAKSNLPPFDGGLLWAIPLADQIDTTSVLNLTFALNGSCETLSDRLLNPLSLDYTNMRNGIANTLYNFFINNNQMINLANVSFWKSTVTRNMTSQCTWFTGFEVTLNASDPLPALFKKIKEASNSRSLYLTLSFNSFYTKFSTIVFLLDPCWTSQLADHVYQFQIIVGTTWNTNLQNSSSLKSEKLQNDIINSLTQTFQYSFPLEKIQLSPFGKFEIYPSVNVSIYFSTCVDITEVQEYLEKTSKSVLGLTTIHDNQLVKLYLGTSGVPKVGITMLLIAYVFAIIVAFLVGYIIGIIVNAVVTRKRRRVEHV